jgi:N-acetylmuramoyl-L-alanine amidase
VERIGPLFILLFAATLALVALLSVRPVPEILVVVDAGHGGHDPGAEVSGVREKDLNLTLALLVARKAQGIRGLRVVLTRSTDTYVDLVERVKMAEALGAALYLSIHANYHRDPKVCGIETWVDTNAGQESQRLAECVQRAVVSAVGGADRGVRRQTLYLRHTSLPAALVEVGFLSCPSERKKLLDPAYQERIAEGILQGIREFLGI